MEPTPRQGSPLGRFFGGVGMFFRGFGLWSTSPGLMALGALPALLVGIAVIGLLILLGVNLDGVAAWVTPFADGWAEVWRTAFRFAVGLALFVLAILIAVSTFTAITLAVGDPFYERIWLAVERRLGGFEPSEVGFWASLRRGIGSGVRLIALSVTLGLGVFVLGLIPVAGTVLGFALGAFGGGWLVATELLGRPLDARSLRPDQQRALRRRNRGSVLGFGVAVYLVFLIPFAAILATPAAVAGSAVLARRLLESAGSAELERSDRRGGRRP